MRSPTSTSVTSRTARPAWRAVVAATAAAALPLTACGPSATVHRTEKPTRATPCPPSADARRSGDAPAGGDVDGDGIRDLVFGSLGAAEGDAPYVAVVRGSHKEWPDPTDRTVFRATDLGITDESEAPSPGTADLDGDGHLDLFAGEIPHVLWGGPGGPRPGAPATRIALPHVAEGQSTGSAGPGEGLYESDFSAGDFDGDGHTDLVSVRSSMENSPLVMLHGPFARSGRPARVSELRAAELGDSPHPDLVVLGAVEADDDDATDLVVLDGRSRPVLLTGGARTPTGFGRTPRALGEGTGVVSGDFDGDGRKDLVVADHRADDPENETDWERPDERGRMTVSYGASPGRPQRFTGARPGEGFGMRLAVGDLDGDGCDDLVVQVSDTYGDDARIEVLHGGRKGLGSKPWRSTSRLVDPSTKGDDAVDNDPQLIEVADHNGDGRDDVVLATGSYTGPRSHWWITDGTRVDECAFTTEGFGP